MLIVEDGKAEIVERHKIDAREHLALRTVAGDSCTIVKPFVSEEQLTTMRTRVREILDEERGQRRWSGRITRMRVAAGAFRLTKCGYSHPECG